MNIKTFVTDKKNLPVFIIIICALIVFVVFGGENAPSNTAENEEDPAAVLEARLERVLEKVSGRIFASKNASMRLPMASTTKIITAITVIEKEVTSLPTDEDMPFM